MSQEQQNELLKQIIEFADTKQKEINTLIEENEKFKTEFKILTDFCPCGKVEGGVALDPTAQGIVDWICGLFIHEDRADKLQKENQKLKEEIEQLKN
tara:strand:+ start:1465 stop:1755 length:291 start_codon:yes stop_codon:yes gene_type:complete